jgi:hypothetical protein
LSHEFLALRRLHLREHTKQGEVHVPIKGNEGR